MIRGMKRLDAPGFSPESFSLGVQMFERAVELDPEDAYAYVLMARDYTMLARRATVLTRGHYREQALQMRQRAAGVSIPDVRRLVWLDGWLSRMLPKVSGDG